MVNRINLFVLPLLFVSILITGCGKGDTDKDGGGAPVEKPTGSDTEQKAGPLIGFSFGDLKEERWKRDRAMFRAKAEALGATVLIQDAGGDTNAQIEQCRILLLRGVKVLVVVPKNADASAPIVKAAHERGVKVLSYDRLITHADTDIYISFNNYHVGEIQAAEILKRAPKGKYLLLGGDPADKNASMLRSGQMKVLEESIRNGNIQVIADPFCDKWLRSEATRHAEDAIAKHPDLVAIVASNDGTAGGAIAALRAKGLEGKVLVSGQDADLEACQAVVAGYQTLTVYKPIRQLAEAAAVIAVALANGDSVEDARDKVEGEKLDINNDKIDVPTIFLTPIPVTKETIDSTVIADGYHSRLAIYGEE